MAIKSDSAAYGLLTRALHWSIAAFIICLIASGWLADDFKPIIPIHKATGILVLVLSITRLAWWLLDGPRPGDDDLHWEKWPSRLAKWSLAALGLIMPLSGWLMSSAADKPISFYGLFTVPPLLSPDKDLAHLFKESHETLGTVIALILAAHVLGALRHHFITKDNVLIRMLPCAAKFGRPTAAE